MGIRSKNRQERVNMQKTFIAFLTTALVILAASAAVAEQPIKIGVILAYSGPFAGPSTQMDNGIKLYMLEHGDTVAGKKIELIRKDTGGVAPLVAKRLAQDLITREKVDLFAGFLLTPNALAVADISAQEKRFMVNMNAAGATITTKSPYMVRTSLTVPQLNETLGIWTRRNGVRTVYTIVADFGLGHEALRAALSPCACGIVKIAKPTGSKP
jgi:branched-chain amino acid transport system substrate-binding protein